MIHKKVKYNLSDIQNESNYALKEPKLFLDDLQS